MPEHEELNRVPIYDQMDVSNRSSVIGQRSALDENCSFGLSLSSSDDEFSEDDLIMDRLWKVNGNECESSFCEVHPEREDLLSRVDSTNTTSTVKSEVSIC